MELEETREATIRGELGFLPIMAVITKKDNQDATVNFKYQFGASFRSMYITQTSLNFDDSFEWARAKMQELINVFANQDETGQLSDLGTMRHE